MKKMKIVKPRKPTKREQLTRVVMQDHAHLSTADITRKRIVLACEENAAEMEIRELTNRLSSAKARQVAIETTIDALAAVISIR